MTEDIIRPNTVTMAYLAHTVTGIIRKNGEKLLESNDSELAAYFYYILSIFFDGYETKPGETHDLVLKAARESAEVFQVLHEMHKEMKEFFAENPELKKQISDLVKSIDEKESAVPARERKTTELPKVYGTAN